LFAAAGIAAALASGTLLIVLAVGAGYGAAYLVTMPDRSGRRISLSPLVTAAALLLADGDPALLLPAAGIGMPIGWWLLRTRGGSRHLDHVFPGDPASLVAAVLVYHACHGLLVGALGHTSTAHAATVGLAAAAWYLVAVAARSVASGRRRRIGARRLAWEALHDGPAYLALFSSGAMLGLAWGAIRWWAVPVALLPYGFAHVSLQRAAATRLTHQQTIRALGRIPEAGGQVSAGRAARTGELAAELARRAGMAPAEVERAEFAGFLHDVGRVVFGDPKVAAAGYDDADVAAWGAAIIQESPFLHRVAAVVADQHRPYRRPGEARTEGIPREAQVLKVAAAYDRAVHDRGLTPAESLEELYRGTAYEYDPALVGSLRLVLRQRGTLGS